MFEMVDGLTTDGQWTDGQQTPLEPSAFSGELKRKLQKFVY